MGAPLDQNMQPGTNRSGALWKCPMTTDTRDCVQVITDGRLSEYWLEVDEGSRKVLVTGGRCRWHVVESMLEILFLSKLRILSTACNANNDRTLAVD